MRKIMQTYFLVYFFLIISSTKEIYGQKIKSGSKTMDPPLKVHLTTEKPWIEKSLERHNYFRSLHDAEPLELNKTLSEISQSWVNYMLEQTLVRYRNNNYSFENIEAFFEHNSKVLKKYGLGENIYYSTHYECESLNGSVAVNLFYNEIKDYDFSTGGVKSTSRSDSKIGHFTQIVWKSTKQMGTAFASAKLSGSQSITFVGASYYPSGNVLTHGDNPKKLYFQNVLRPSVDAELEKINSEEVIQGKIYKCEVPTTKVSTDEIWIEKAIEKHNEYRNKHGFPNLLKSHQLCTVSQAWANKLLKRGLENFNQHFNVDSTKNKLGNVIANGKSHFGENIMYFIHDDGIIDPSFPISSWYKEHKYYDFPSRQTNYSISHTAQTQHFVQLLWKGSTHVCMTYSRGQTENFQWLTFIVANYHPTSKIPGIFVPLEERIANIPDNGSESFVIKKCHLIMAILTAFLYKGFFNSYIL